MTAALLGRRSTSLDASSKTVHSKDRHVMPATVPKRLLQTESSLEAEYAVLSEANAKSAELEALLRNSQPLVWLDNALVLQRDKAPVVRNSTMRRRVAADKPHIGNGGAGFDDEEVLDELFFESDRRRQRRVQWEVAKRIARVQREITRQPSAAQRSWHVREKKRLEEEQQRRHQEALALATQRRQEERDERLRAEKEKKTRQPSEAKRTALTSREPSTVLGTSTHTKIPPLKGAVDLEFGWEVTAEKFVEEPTIPMAAEDSEEGKETARPPLIMEAVKPSPIVPTPSEIVVPSNERVALMKSRDLLEDTTLATPPPLFATAHTKQEISLAEQEGMESYDVADRRLQGDSHVGHKTHTPSSLGRQVSSEHRTMATAVSFGAPALVGSSLNSDVLRRLFSDLDTDHDGHLNRLETSLALHRLRIHVSAPRIVAFFKRIHLMQEGNELTRRDPRGSGRPRTHEPLKEVINYKQFVAFVTTAFDQQQQQRQQQQEGEQQEQTRHKSQQDCEQSVRTKSLPLPLSQLPRRTEGSPPSLVPSRAGENLSRLPRHDHPSADDQYADDQPRRLVEHQTDEGDGDDVAGRVLRQLPDILMARALAATTAEVPHGDANLQQIVRKSLERLGKCDLEGAIVGDVTRDLVRKYAEKVLSTRYAGGPVDEIEDVSGVRRAAAFFESLGVQESSGCDTVDIRGDEEDPTVAWWKVLTEEQVACLVQEIWTQRQRSAPPPAAEQEQGFDSSSTRPPSLSPEIADEDTVIKEDQMTHRSPETSSVVNEGVGYHVPRVADKSIQTRSFEFVTITVSPTPPLPPSSPPPPPPPPPPPLEDLVEEIPSTSSRADEPVASPAARTTLGRALLASTRTDLQTERRPQAHGSRTKEVLATLRRQRRRRQATIPVAFSFESVGNSVASASMGDQETFLPTTRFPTSSEICNAHKVKPLYIEDRRDELSEITNAPMVNPVEVVSPPLPVREIRLHAAVSPITPSRLGHSLTSSSPASSSDVSSSYGSSLSASPQLFREHTGDDVWRYAAQRRQHRLGRRRGYRNQTVASSSVNGSLDQEADLSEGEIILNPTKSDDLSDGELFGATRRKIVRAKNARVADMSKSVGSGDAVRSSAGSLESGELMASAVRSFRDMSSPTRH
jgi:hypothetical protein